MKKAKTACVVMKPYEYQYEMYNTPTPKKKKFSFFRRKKNIHSCWVEPVTRGCQVVSPYEMQRMQGNLHPCTCEITDTYR